MPDVDVPTYGRLSSSLRTAPYYRERIHSHKALDNMQEAIKAEEAEYEMEVLEEVNHQTVVQVVTRNVEYLLKQEELLSEDMRVIIPAGAYDYDLVSDENQSGHFGGDFEIFLEDKIVAYGNVVGTITFEPPELVDISVELNEVVGK